MMHSFGGTHLEHSQSNQFFRLTRGLNSWPTVQGEIMENIGGKMDRNPSSLRNKILRRTNNRLATFDSHFFKNSMLKYIFHKSKRSQSHANNLTYLRSAPTSSSSINKSFTAYSNFLENEQKKVQYVPWICSAPDKYQRNMTSG